MAPPRIDRLVSGGQTGADRAALDAAIAHGLPYGGWCPAGGWAEDHPAAPGLLAVYPALTATGSADPGERTRLNVRESHATLILRTPGARSPGTDLTRRTAAALDRPCLESAGDVDEILDWLDGLGPGLTLNVTGPRESEQPGLYAHSRRVLGEVLRRSA